MGLHAFAHISIRDTYEPADPEFFRNLPLLPHFPTELESNSLYDNFSLI
jgi:hypothetical protein